MKLIKRTKKGFTLVELIVVIAIVAILAAVSVVSYLAFINSANESADIQLVKQLNTCLQAEEALHGKQDFTFKYDKLETLLEENGFIVENLTKTKSGCDIVYQGSDKDNKIVNRYALLNGDKVIYSESTFQEECYFKYLWIPESRDEAITLTNDHKGVVLGNDVGEVASFTAHGSVIVYGAKVGALRYENNEANKAAQKNVAIRTDGGTLSVNAPQDSAKHYGFADSISIEKIYNKSYHEHGRTYQIDISNGRVVLESDSKVWSIHLNATSNAYDDITIATAQGVDLPEFISRDGISVETDTLMVTLEQLDSTGSVIESETEKVWITAAGDIADKDATKNAGVTSEWGQKFLESVGNTNVHTKEETKQEAEKASIEVGENAYELSNKEDLILFRNLVNAGQSFAGCTVDLMEDVDLEGMDWEPIGYLTDTDYTSSYDYDKAHRYDNSNLGGLVITDSKPFRGLFDGNGHTIFNYKPIQIENTTGVGLFGLVCGSTYNSSLHGPDSAKDLMLTNSTINTNKLAESNYSSVVKDLNVENVFAGNDNNLMSFTGAVVGIAYAANINTCIVKNFECKGYNVCGGIVGNAAASVIQNCTNGTTTVPGFVDGLQNAGGIVGTIENYFYVGGYSRTVLYKCTNYSFVRVSSTNAGGIVGLAQGYGNSAIIDCENNGNVAITVSTGKLTTSYSAGGVAGKGTDVSLFYHCTNNGAVQGPDSLSIGAVSKTYYGVQVGGITTYMSNGYFYNCVNNGNLSGKAHYMGGIVSATHNTSTTLTLVNCGNNGVINNSFDIGLSSPICSAGSAIIQMQGQVDKLSYVQEFINTLTSDVDLTGVTVTDKEDGELLMPSKCANINVNSNVCDSIAINASNKAKLTITAPYVDVKITGDISNTDVIVEQAKSVTIGSNGAAKELSIGNVTNVVNNGVLAGLQFCGNDLVVNVVNNNTIAKTGSYCISFYSGAKAVAGNNITVNFMNYGSVSSTGSYTLSVHNGNNNVIKFHCANGSNLTTGQGSGFVGLVRTDSDIAAGNSGTEAINISYDNESCKHFGSLINDKNGLSTIKLIADADFNFENNF